MKVRVFSLVVLLIICSVFLIACSSKKNNVDENQETTSEVNISNDVKMEEKYIKEKVAEYDERYTRVVPEYIFNILDYIDSN